MAKRVTSKLPSDAELLTIEQASTRLGKGFSRSSIIRRISSGEWQEGIHWVDARRGGAANRIVKINITAVMNEFATPAAFR
ncbi:MAG: hypothetical protein ACHBN1_31210 [Heteroscytonema crispum UTEX LB 1556]